MEEAPTGSTARGTPVRVLNCNRSVGLVLKPTRRLTTRRGAYSHCDQSKSRAGTETTSVPAHSRHLSIHLGSGQDRGLCHFTATASPGVRKGRCGCRSFYGTGRMSGNGSGRKGEASS
eukprot:GHVU01094839.1.p1 GENE.GHVU01094839.1~~GHVU01094839.1.p1  ORF type:complete len:118 (-),score=1.50 GHVU01094839.1:884-1237(-)